MEKSERSPNARAQRLHIAVCTDGVFPLSTGGMQRHSRLLVEHLARTGAVDLTVLHPHEEGIFKELGQVREVSLPPINTGRLYLPELWRYSKHAASALDRLRPDVILGQGFSVWAGVERFRERLIFHPHGLEMFQGLTPKERAMGLPFRLLVRHLARQARHTVSLGGKLTQILQSVQARDVVVVPNAVDVPPAPPARISHGTTRFLFVGRFAFNKGIDLLMQAAQRLAAQQALASFQLAGDGPLYEHYREMGLPPNVELLGRVDDDRLFNLYATRDCFVLPTRFEGMPTVVLEAMARGCPIIVSDVGATADQVLDGITGWLLPPGDGDALYQGLRRFIALPAQEREAMGQAGHDLAKTKFSWPEVASSFLRLFRQVAAGRPGPTVHGRPEP